MNLVSLTWCLKDFGMFTLSSPRILKLPLGSFSLGFRKLNFKSMSQLVSQHAPLHHKSMRKVIKLRVRLLRAKILLTLSQPWSE